MLIDTKKIEKAIFTGTSKSVAEKFGLSKNTVDAYRTKPDSKKYRNWKGISIDVAEKIMRILDDEADEESAR